MSLTLLSIPLAQLSLLHLQLLFTSLLLPLRIGWLCSEKWPLQWCRQSTTIAAGGVDTAEATDTIGDADFARVATTMAAYSTMLHDASSHHS